MSPRNCLTPWIGVTVGAVAGLGGWSQQAVAQSRVVESDSVRAEYSDQRTDYCLTQPHLQIARNGSVVFDQDLTTEVGFCRQEQERFEILDLNGDQEPEVILDFYSGGAHCCWFSQIFEYDMAQNQYTTLEHFWGNAGGSKVEDLDGDGQPEFISADNRFAYQFSSFAGSAFPPQIWQYRQGTMVDVTRNYPEYVYERAAEMWQYYTEARQQDYEVKGILAAYLATQYLLGQDEEGWAQVEQAYEAPDRAQFFASLRDFLQETGYAPKPEALPISSAVGTTLVLLEVEGILEEGDRILPTDNSLYDEHSFEGQRGQPVIITLESEDFDPYLVLVSPDNDLVSENDDMNDFNRNSSLTTILPDTGTYLAIANAFDATGRGRYRLTVRAIVGATDPAPEDHPDNTGL